MGEDSVVQRAEKESKIINNSRMMSLIMPNDYDDSVSNVRFSHNTIEKLQLGIITILIILLFFNWSTYEWRQDDWEQNNFSAFNRGYGGIFLIILYVLLLTTYFIRIELLDSNILVFKKQISNYNFAISRLELFRLITIFIIIIRIIVALTNIRGGPIEGKEDYYSWSIGLSPIFSVVIGLIYFILIILQCVSFENTEIE